MLSNPEAVAAMTEALSTCPTRISIDPTPDGRILLVSVDDDLRSSVLLLTPANAYKLAQMLIAVAESVEMP